MTIGIIGCGSMGGAMAKHLHSLDQTILCFDVNDAIRANIDAAGLPLANSAKELAARCEHIILSLPNAAIVRAVMAEVHDAIKPNSIVLDTSTSEPDTSRQIAIDASTAGYSFIDAPVSGGQAAAASGNMTMLLGGEEGAIARVHPLIDLLTAKIVHVGESGAGHAAKITNNMLCAANLVLVTEAIRLAEASGISAATLLEGVNAGSGRSGVSEVNFPNFILNNGFDSGFTMGLMRKDVRLAIDLAKQSDTPLPGFSRIADIWEASRRDIADEEDFHAISKYVSSGAN